MSLVSIVLNSKHLKILDNSQLINLNFLYNCLFLVSKSTLHEMTGHFNEFFGNFINLKSVCEHGMNL